MTSALQLLPREVRDQIYLYVLKSPTGYIVLSDTCGSLVSWTWRRHGRHLKIHPYDPLLHYILPSTISLSLLRTSKQTYGDCKDVLWHSNALCLYRPEDLYYFVQLRSFAQQLSLFLEHVHLRVDIADVFGGSGLDDIARALKIFVTWSHIPNTRFRILDLRFNYQEWLDMPELAKVLKYVGRLKGFSAQVKKRMIVDLKPDFANQEDVFQPDNLLLSMHTGFGGELFINNVMWYNNSVKM